MATTASSHGHRLRRAVRRTRPHRGGDERPVWQLAVVLYAVISLLIVVVIVISFAVAYAVTGSAY